MEGKTEGKIQIGSKKEERSLTASPTQGGAQQVAFINLFDDDGDGDGDGDHDHDHDAGHDHDHDADADADADRDHNYDDSAITHSQSDEIGAQQVIHLLKAKPNKKDASKEG